MRKAHRMLAHRLARAVARDEALADLSAEEAAYADRIGEDEKANVLRDLARRHRVHAIQQEARRRALQSRSAGQVDL